MIALVCRLAGTCTGDAPSTGLKQFSGFGVLGFGRFGVHVCGQGRGLGSRQAGEGGADKSSGLGAVPPAVVARSVSYARRPCGHFPAFVARTPPTHFNPSASRGLASWFARRRAARRACFESGTQQHPFLGHAYASALFPRTRARSLVHTPPWQDPMLQVVPSGWRTNAHCPVVGSQGLPSHSLAGGGQTTPAHRSVKWGSALAGLEGL